MYIRKLGLGIVAAAFMAVPAWEAWVTAAQADSIFIPQSSYRTGKYSVNGTPFANGFDDYLAMLNARDGGIEGVTIDTEECEFGYSTDKGVECYERFKSKNPVAYTPLSTGVTYKLVPKAPVDKIPVLSSGYGMSAAADGRWFPYVFNFPTSYWSQASAFIRYVGEQEGGLDKLKGKKIGLIFLESGYGREPIPLLKALAEKYGYEFQDFSVPGKEMEKQQAQWRRRDVHYRHTGVHQEFPRTHLGHRDRHRRDRRCHVGGEVWRLALASARGWLAARNLRLFPQVRVEHGRTYCLDVLRTLDRARAHFRAQRAGAALANRQGEAPALAIPLLGAIHLREGHTFTRGPYVYEREGIELGSNPLTRGAIARLMVSE